MALYTERLACHLAAVEKGMAQALPKEDAAVSVAPLMAYACEGGGKRLRPVLLLEFCRLCGGNTEAVLPFAAAVEMIHSYSLVHDDLPCMDNSPLRRGKPSVHAAYGETMALLAGDALLNRAFEVMLEPKGEVPPAVALRAAHELAHNAGIYGMIGGQVLDLACEGKAVTLSTLQELQKKKTGALITASCRMGAILGGGSEEHIEQAGRYGDFLGACFQIVDDILDITSNAETLGKPVGSDDEHQKNTYVSLLGLEEARRRAAEYTEQAKTALTMFGESRTDLCALAEALLVRSH